ncbi:TIGR01244 family sulfur transferase [Aestuariivirga sp.]|jgi:sulfide:quinone oxidoreductase|uniref:TIGR01244 family sulfur transferase n=1 Tax=Aestuariivirga sp. TaxID=2650926 RepID=UPI00378481D9
MNPKSITPTLSVSEQIQPQEIAALAAAGFKAIICNRPDDEGADQPPFSAIEAVAQAAGMQAAYLPVVSGKVDEADAQAFGLLMDRLPKPILAYCRTGTRSATLWSLSEAARGRPLAEIISATQVAGYDMAGVMRALPMSGTKT